MVSKWHYREKLIQLKAEFNVTNNLINLLEQIEDSNLKIKSRLKTWFKLLLARPWRSKLSWLFWYWSTSGFGERPKRAGFVLIGLALFPLICLAIAAVIETGPALSINTTRAAQVVVDWLRLISFIKQEAATTDSSLLGASKLTLSSAWQLLIALQAALFGFALRNKFRR